MSWLRSCRRRLEIHRKKEEERLLSAVERQMVPAKKPFTYFRDVLLTAPASTATTKFFMAQQDWDDVVKGVE